MRNNTVLDCFTEDAPNATIAWEAGAICRVQWMACSMRRKSDSTLERSKRFPTSSHSAFQVVKALASKHPDQRTSTTANFGGAMMARLMQHAIPAQGMTCSTHWTIAKEFDPRDVPEEWTRSSCQLKVLLLPSKSSEDLIYVPSISMYPTHSFVAVAVSLD